MTPIQLMLLLRLNKDSMTLIGDVTQTIYDHGRTSWNSLDVTIDHRRTLTTCHRCTLETVLFANAVVGETENATPSEKVSRRGKKPVIALADDVEQTLDYVATQIKEIQDVNSEASCIVVLPSRGRVTDAVMRLRDAGVNAYEASRNSWDFSAKVHVTTYQQVKGLECDHMFVLGLNDFENWSIFNNKDRILYTVLTRPRYRAYVVVEDEVPEMLVGVDEDLYEIERV
jgi:DNA helicase IV